jgi:UDP-N-acetylmuramoylalanine--D-glutamate ligase
MRLDFQRKKVLVIGMARSGIAATKALCQAGACVTINDIKPEAALKEDLRELKGLPIETRLGEQADHLVDDKDFIVISPSVPIESSFVHRARALKVPVYSELELGYRMCTAPIVAITGTNGKTTTTALTGQIFIDAKRRTHVVGNIGIPFTGKVTEMTPNDIVVAEVSSFQLEAIHAFHPKVAAVLNITEDHLNRHKSMENYIAMKSRIFMNQRENDFLVLNRDDELTAAMAEKSKSKVLFFSRKMKVENGVYLDAGKIVLSLDEQNQVICLAEEIGIPGVHNLENALAAVAIAAVMGVTAEDIVYTLRTFAGVEHRLEFVKELDGIRFINDSKATNPEASIKAIEAMNRPTLLIAGGMDKGSDFTGFVDAFGEKIKALLVLGETAEKIIQTAESKGFRSVYHVSTIGEAVRKAYEMAKPGWNVLLSPACASWDMFKDFEERGRVFKDAIHNIRR